MLSIVSTVATNKRAPDKYLSLECSLHLPNNLAHLTHYIGYSSVTAATRPPMTIQSQPLSDFSANLDGFTDVSFDNLGVTKLRTLLADARTTISLPVVTPISKGVQPSSLFPSITPTRTPAATFSSTLKMDRIRSVPSSQGMMTYTVPLDVLDTQPRFDLVFENNPIMCRLFSLKHKQRATEEIECLAEKTT